MGVMERAGLLQSSEISDNEFAIVLTNDDPNENIAHANEDSSELVVLYARNWTPSMLRRPAVAADMFGICKVQACRRNRPLRVYGVRISGR